ncbi:MAG: hypothetical protein QXG39_01635 [Candidatus Aenigmatarchaeota archaeon]
MNLRTILNVIFEIWNEPHNEQSSNKTSEEAFIDWTNAWNLCVAAIREEAQPTSHICNRHLTDPLNNIIYSTHLYRLYGGTGLYQFSARDKYGYY